MPPPHRVRWTRDQLLIVLNLYHKLRFGQFDQRQAVIIDLAILVGLGHLDASDTKTADQMKLLYVGMTRAK
jgi:hypothetical protein